MSTRASVKETAAAMRKALRAKYPGTKFSVRMATGSAYGWIDVFYTDGPEWREVQSFTAQFESSRFDGMDDAYHQTEVTDWSCCGVLIHDTRTAPAEV